MPPFSPQEYYCNDDLQSSISLPNDDDMVSKEQPLLQAQHERRNVRFATCDEVFEIPHINELSQEEIDAVYMSYEEGRAIRRTCSLLCKVFANGIQEAQIAGECVRGLEAHIPQYIQRTYTIRQQLYDAIHEIQYFEDKTGLDMSDMIADTCQKHSRPLVTEAMQCGLLDAKIAGNWESNKNSDRGSLQSVWREDCKWSCAQEASSTQLVKI
jgi:hypothetical protein